MMTKKKSFQTAFFAVLLVGGIAVFLNRGPRAVEPTAAPAWELRDLDGEIVRWSDFEGKVVAVNFWATWCPPCRIEIPGFTQLQEEYGDDGFVIVGISLDEAPPSVVAEFSEEMEVNYPVVMGDPAVVAAFGGVRGLPTTFIIDREGMIRSVHTGYLAKNAFGRAIKPLL